MTIYAGCCLKPDGNGRVGIQLGRPGRISHAGISTPGSTPTTVSGTTSSNIPSNTSGLAVAMPELFKTGTLLRGCSEGTSVLDPW